MRTIRIFAILLFSIIYIIFPSSEYLPVESGIPKKSLSVKPFTHFAFEAELMPFCVQGNGGFCGNGFVASLALGAYFVGVAIGAIRFSFDVDELFSNQRRLAAFAGEMVRMEMTAHGSDCFLKMSGDGVIQENSWNCSKLN